MKLPTSTYRIQLSAEFPLEDLQQQIDYFNSLGVSTIYAAPLFQSKEGSAHGYDVLDPYTINKEIGSLENFRILGEDLRSKGMSWLQDIVPNHMAFDVNNPWIKEIFELGPGSEYYRYFDIDWKDSGKLMFPVLGNPLEEVLEKGEIKLQYDENGFSFSYFQHRAQVSARSYTAILKTAEVGKWGEKFKDFLGNDNQWEDLKMGLYRETQDDPDLMKEITSAVELVNSTQERFLEVLDLQFFHFVHWQKTEAEINYRRFFTINDLICLRMEDPKVFESYHYYLKELVEQNLVNGLRVDHIDGLFNPSKYLKELKNLVKEDIYIVVEKILGSEEEIPSEWPVQGTTGYDFLAQVNQVFTEGKNESLFTRCYGELAPELTDYENLVYEKKQFILRKKMGGELTNLVQLLEELELLRKDEGSPAEAWRNALSYFLAGFPIYRIYPEGFPLNETGKAIVENAFNTAVTYAPESENELNYLKSLFLGKAEKEAEKMLHFLQRSQQFTGPLAAKGVEDTVFYIYNRLISHNEVGDTPHKFGMRVGEFHQKMQERLKKQPHSLNATATHDTKRGEDARMRINVLSELPEEWFEKVKEWRELNQHLKKTPDLPDPSEEYFLYQVLLGGFPFKEVEDENFLSRCQEYLKKALREAKVHSNWVAPNEEYERAVLDFTSAIMKEPAFRKSFDAFFHKVAHYGMLKSLGQTLIKITAPGIPDIYQGTELWDFNFVDPDNRRPVSYDLRKKHLTGFQLYKGYDLKKKLTELLRSPQDGKIKMYLLFKLLNFRKSHPAVFEKGTYLPLEVSGQHSENILAYARSYQEEWLVVIVPLMVTKVFHATGFEVKEGLENTRVFLPEKAPAAWKNCLTDGLLNIKGELQMGELLDDFPVICLTNLI